MTSAVSIRTAPLPAAATGTVVFYAAAGSEPPGAAAALWSQTGLDWTRISTAASFKGMASSVVDLLAPGRSGADRLIVIGRNEETEALARSPSTDRGGFLAGKLLAARVETAAILLDGLTPEEVADFAAGLRLRAYRFDLYKSKKKDDEPDATQLDITLHVDDPAACEAALAERDAVTEGTLLARNLINEPANVLGTLEFVERAMALAELGVTVEVLDESQMASLGMNSLLCVAKGSRRPPRLVVMQWRGGEPDAQPLAFIGKGVVFDSGGISIKQAAGMEDMKGDMGGAAAVTGLMHALATRKARVNAIGVIGLVENMPDGNATRPGDIVKAMSGITIEVINTDAEGRLVLADALWYTQDRFKPRFMIDLATLTGAIIVALGHDHAGLFANDDELAGRLLTAGLDTGEKVWRLPLGPFYDKMIESRFADIKNTGGRHAGSITAAQFLQRFVNKVPWAHLDIAGVGMGAPPNDTNTSWGPGFGVALLDRLVRGYEA